MSRLYINVPWSQSRKILLLDPDGSLSVAQLSSRITGAKSLSYYNRSNDRMESLPVINGRIYTNKNLHKHYFASTTTPPRRNALSTLAMANRVTTLQENVQLSTTSFCKLYQKNGRCGRKVCRLLHGERCDICGQYSLNPHDEEQRLKHSEECFQQQQQNTIDQQQNETSKQCAICLESLAHKQQQKKTFGILQNCTHVFCFECINEWSNQPINSFGNVICPLCRRKSAKVLECDKFIIDDQERKQYFTNGGKKSTSPSSTSRRRQN